MKCEINHFQVERFFVAKINGGDISPNHDHPIPGMVLQVGVSHPSAPGTAATDDPTDWLPSPELRGLAPRAAEDLVTRERNRGGGLHRWLDFFDVLEYTTKVKHSLWKMVVRRLLSYWGGLFSGAMLNFEGVRLEQKFKIHTMQSFPRLIFDIIYDFWLFFVCVPHLLGY